MARRTLRHAPGPRPGEAEPDARQVAGGGARAVWTGLMVLIGLLAVGLQMDRQARYDPTLAQKVPAAFRSHALEALAREAYVEKDYEQGLIYSRQLVIRRPVPGENLGLLAKGLLQTGQGEQALSALLLSASRGWRDPFTQAAMTGLALQTGDPQVAAQRTLALWRTFSIMPTTKFLTGQLFATPGGYQAFADGMLARDQWGTTLLLWAIGTHQPASRLQNMAQTMAARRMVVSCSQMEVPLRKLGRTGNAATAGWMWSRLCPQLPAKAPGDLAFNAPSGPGPFNWRYGGEAGLSQAIVPVSGGTGIDFSNAGYSKVTLASRSAALAPGPQAIRMPGSYAGIDLAVQVTCFDSRGGQRDTFAGAPVGGIVRFMLPSSCIGQEITISVGHGQGTLGPLRAK